MKLIASLYVTCLAALSTLSYAADIEPINIEHERQNLGSRKEYSTRVKIPPLEDGIAAILEFKAWFEAPESRGYFGVLRAFWSGEELREALERPATFIIKDGREQPTYGVSGWMTAAVPEPGMIYSEESRYSIISEFENFSRYRFLLPPSQGEQELKIVNRRGKRDKTSLVLEDIRIIFVRKDQLGPVLDVSQ